MPSIGDAGPTTATPKGAQIAAYRFLKDAILGGALAAGIRIKPEEVGATLGISRMPVREALVQLEAEGLVTFGANRRPVVTSRTADEIVELFEIRTVLETLAIERATPRLGPAAFAALDDLLARMNAATTDRPRWMALHAAFHDTIYTAARMPRLLQEIRRLRQSILPYLRMYHDFYGVDEMPGAEHRALLVAIRTGDPAVARDSLANHIHSAAAGVTYFLLGGRLAAREQPSPGDRKLAPVT
jgi:DNA-binding GntR family transcriptional regulator